MAQPVSFDYARWIARYPEFSAVPQATAQEYFAEATLYWRNDGTSPNRTQESQTIFLNMLTAHIAAIYSQDASSLTPGAPQPANTVVGRISSATEGSVTVASELQTTPGTGGLQPWLSQTKYGLQFWAAIGPYKTMQYVGGSLQPGGLPPGEGALYPGLFNPWMNQWQR